MNSIDKIIEYVAKVSKETITVNDKVILSKPIETVTLTSKFFVKDDCVMCGRCCPNENTAYSLSHLQIITQAVNDKDFEYWNLDYSNRNKLIDGMEELVYNINGKEIPFYSYPKDPPRYCNKVAYKDRGIVERCHWLFEDGGLYKCKIHPMRSITCGMPHLRFFYNSKLNRTNLSVSQFGRNWRLGCPIEFGEELDEKSVQTRMYWLRLLSYAATDMGITTFLPEILDYLDSGKREPVQFSNKNTSKRRKLF